MPDITYGRFLRILRELGFRADPARSTDKHTTYWRGEGGLPVILAVRPDAAPLWPPHLSQVRMVFRHEDPDDTDRFEVLIRTDPSTWPVTAGAMTPTRPPLPPPDPTSNGRPRKARRPKRVPPAG